MLTLIEPPGAKQHQRLQSGQYLLGTRQEDDYDDEYVSSSQETHVEEGDGCCAPIDTILSDHLVGKSNSGEYSDRWKKQFEYRPSWCDADLCLQQIRRRKATGNKWALYSRCFIQKCLFSLGNFVQSNAWSVIIFSCVFFAFCCFGLQYVRIETDIVKLWVSKGGRLDEELNFHQSMVEKMNVNATRDENSSDLPRENGLGGGYQVVIQTPEEDENVLTTAGLLKHVRIMEEISQMSVNVLGINWTLSDLCFKPAKPELQGKANDFSVVIDAIIPCIWITPIDCFWEGSKPLGPHPALKRHHVSTMNALDAMSEKHLPGKNITWMNINPGNILRDVAEIEDMGTYKLMFERAQMGKGYLDRPCLNPLDINCPKQAPNYYNVGINGRLQKWLDYMKQTGQEAHRRPYSKSDMWDLLGSPAEDEDDHYVDPYEVKEEEGEERRKRDVEQNATTIVEEAARESAPLTEDDVEAFHRPMLRWMAGHKKEWQHFLPQSEWPVEPDVPAVMHGGCSGFARGVLNWPEDMILGKAQRDEKGRLVSARALQSVFLVASPNDIYLRINSNKGGAKGGALRGQNWTVAAAEEVMVTWQRQFTAQLYNHTFNFVPGTDKSEVRRTVHPLASTSIADMLKEFCQFNYTIIFIGYGLMLVYAMVTQLRTDGWLPAAHSCMGLAVAGVLTVTLASVAGLGLSTWFGIEFNAATTQIVPFLTLGIGVDNMFMLLHNYHDVVGMTTTSELGILLRETGMSLLCTSSNNILSFLAGTLLPIPALRSFCAQSTILLTFNFIAILTMYPAIISLDLRRRKTGQRDILCCLLTAPPTNQSYTMIGKGRGLNGGRRTAGEDSYPQLISATAKKMPNANMSEPVHHAFLEEVIPYTLHAAIRNYYIPFIKHTLTKVLIILFSIGLCCFAVVGMQRAEMGLELSDVLPAHTPPAAFLKARDEFFSFYPMFAVLKGPMEYEKKQAQIRSYRKSIGASKFVIRNSIGEPSEPFWLGMMTDWLKNIQNVTERAIEEGIIDRKTGEIVNRGRMNDDIMTGYRLLCSHNYTLDCAGRMGVKLVDDSNIINVEGFYNYLTAWFNQDNMMYYVTQASFFPSPPKWSLDDNETLLIPPAAPLAYSQIPFYLHGLTNTPTVVEAVKEIRAICDNFSADALPNFPQGIAFTFWEQYLYLHHNLLQAIGTIALAVFCVLSLLLFNPWAAASILSILVCMTVQLAGFLGWAGIKLNPVSAVTLITAVGIGVEFTAHVVMAFLTSLGTREQRMAQAVDRVFVPVIHGALSTLLGIIMLAFSEFEFVVKYFFVVMTALIVIGLINGLVLLPVLLSLIGPPTEITPLPSGKGDGYGRDWKRKLAVPPPLAHSVGGGRGHSQQHVHDGDEDGQGVTMYPLRV